MVRSNCENKLILTNFGPLETRKELKKMKVVWRNFLLDVHSTSQLNDHLKIVRAVNVCICSGLFRVSHAILTEQAKQFLNLKVMPVGEMSAGILSSQN